MRIRTIAIIVAMQEEAGAIRDALALEEIEAPFPRHLPMGAFERRTEERRVVLVTNGRDRRREAISLIGTQAATLAAHVTIDSFAPDVLISAGTAGGFSRSGAKIGDVYLSNGVFRFHDRIIPLPGYQEYGIGSYPSLDVSRVAVDTGLRMGEVTTGDSFEASEAHRAQFETHEPAVKEMEAAAIAWVASLSATPFFAIKAVSDLVDVERSTTEQFLEHLGRAVDALALSTRRVVAYCLGATLDDLSAGS